MSTEEKPAAALAAKQRVEGGLEALRTGLGSYVARIGVRKLCGNLSACRSASPLSLKVLCFQQVATRSRIDRDILRCICGRTGGRDDELFGRQCGGCTSLRRQ